MQKPYRSRQTGSKHFEPRPRSKSLGSIGSVAEILNDEAVKM